MIMRYVYSYGGRWSTYLDDEPEGDCAVRAIAIASGRPYLEIYWERYCPGWLDGSRKA